MSLRKDFIFLTATERTRVADAFNAAQTSGFIGTIATLHNDNFNAGGIHWASGFLPWHRHVLLRLEAEFASAGFGDVTVPYWDWTRPDSRSIDVQPWASFFGGRATSGGHFDTWPFTRAATGGGTMLPVLTPDGTGAVDIVGELDKATFAEFRSMELFGSHPTAHNWVGGAMAGGRSPLDPLFWLHHCNLDRLWAIWQRNHPAATQYSTADAIPNSDNAFSPDIALDSPMIGGETPASMLDHAALGYTYAADIRLEAAWARAGLGTLITGDPTPLDLYIRDSIADTGNPPSPNPHWHSPDIWVRNDPPGPGETPNDGHQPPILHTPNHIYVRVHNRGTAAASDTVPVEAYRCAPGTGMLWPEHFQGLGSLPLGEALAPGSSTRVGPFIWTPTVEGHECLLAIVRPREADPGSLETIHGVDVPAGEAASIDHSTLVRYDNNVGQLNVAPVPALAGAMESFGLTVRGLAQSARYSLRIDASGMPSGTVVRSRLSRALLETGRHSMAIDAQSTRYTTLALDGGEVGLMEDLLIAGHASYALKVQVDFSIDAEHLAVYPMRIDQILDGALIGSYTIELTAVKDPEDFVFGNPRSRELHISNCPWWPALNRSRLRTFTSLGQGLANGYDGCYYCLRSEHTG